MNNIKLRLLYDEWTVTDSDRERTQNTDKVEAHHTHVIDKMKNDSSTPLDPEREANWAMGVEPVKVKLTSRVFGKFTGAVYSCEINQSEMKWAKPRVEHFCLLSFTAFCHHSKL